MVAKKEEKRRIAVKPNKSADKYLGGLKKGKSQDTTKIKYCPAITSGGLNIGPSYVYDYDAIVTCCSYESEFSIAKLQNDGKTG